MVLEKELAYFEAHKSDLRGSRKGRKSRPGVAKRLQFGLDLRRQLA
jgi:hypothetical protein